MTDADSIEATLDEAARETGLDRDEVLKRAIVALAETNDVDVPDVDDVAAVERRLDEVAGDTPDEGDLDEVRAAVSEVAADVTELDAAVTELNDAVTEIESDLASVEGNVDVVRDGVDDLRADLDDKVQDLRERVVQIYRDVEGKAAADHSHPSLAGAVDDVRSDVADLESGLDEVDTELSALAARVDDVDDRIEDDLSPKLSTVAGALVRMQRRLGELEADRAERETLAELTATANREGIRTADCEECERTVHLPLLSRPTCPHCESRFGGVEPKSGFFGTATLTVGDPPALEGEVAPDDPDDFFDDE